MQFRHMREHIYEDSPELLEQALELSHFVVGADRDFRIVITERQPGGSRASVPAESHSPRAAIRVRQEFLCLPGADDGTETPQ
jgi:hypothetical protein